MDSRTGTTIRATLIFAAAFALTGSSMGQNKACALATPSEIQSTIGAAPSGMKPQSMPSGADICMGQAGSYRVMLRLATRTDSSGDKEAKGIAMAKQMGAQVDVRKFGNTICSTFTPPASMAQAGYNTTCSVSKNGQVGAIEITAKSQAEMVPIDKLQPLADKSPPASGRAGTVVVGDSPPRKPGQASRRLEVRANFDSSSSRPRLRPLARRSLLSGPRRQAQVLFGRERTPFYRITSWA